VSRVVVLLKYTTFRQQGRLQYNSLHINDLYNLD
jgi:hypothetical protein